MLKKRLKVTKRGVVGGEGVISGLERMNQDYTFPRTPQPNAL